MTYYSALHYAAKAEKSASTAVEAAEIAKQFGNDRINQTHITNCITEIPQDIKLELVDGTLTLKAGSKVYVPNGVGKFDEVVISSDLSRTTFAGAAGSKLVFALVGNGTLTALSSADMSICTSGTTAPASGIFYNTNTNYINNFSNSSVADQRSFPIAVVKQDANGTVTSIDQVFNGFGYIGSTVFALPNVKGLIPNGRNADGSLKNIEWTNDVLRVRDYTGANKSVVFALRHPQDIYYNDYPLSITETYAISQDEYMPSGSASCLTEENIWRGHLGSVYYNMFWMPIGSFQTDSSGVISNFSPKLPFRAVDYNDLIVKADKSQFQVVSTLPSSPQSDVFYFIPE